MRSDVVDLRDFYDTRTGHVARLLIRRALRNLWPDVRGQRVLGVGYATPYLTQFRDEAERVLGFMPAQQGVLHWPAEGPGAVSLVDETELPLPDNSMDRVLLVHAVEHSEALRYMLREIWRVMAGNGRLLVVVPNRRGVWARTDRTPFGGGLPYTSGQLSRFLRENMFTPTRSGRALYVPPTRSKALLRTAPAWERLGMRWFPTFSGVVVVEASKQLYAGTLRHEPVRLRLGRPVVVPFPQVANRGQAPGEG